MSNDAMVSLGMTKAPRLVLESLRSIEPRLDRWFDLPRDRLFEKPVDGSWSVAENLEHVSLTNHFLLKIIRRHAERAIERAHTGIEPKDRENNFEAIDQIRSRSSFNWPHPTHMTPKGDADLSEVRESLKEQFGECRQLLKSMENGEGYLVRVNMTVNDLGKLNMYEWIYFLTQHAMRHEDKLSATVGTIGQLQVPKDQIFF
jgi:hypothetical protein